ncbi:MAG: DUF29 domain-containing protein [Xenococcaceae cyanobacterium MO_234.B1]|nr:DUF29 domain-containing protein [Xenococcaceae cyanobacterium MO_234.B1]
MSEQSNLYHQDFDLWLKKSATAIKNKDFQNIDWDNLLTEIEDMGKSQRRALESYTRRLIQHILKLKYWKSERKYNSQHWRIEVRNFRREVKKILEDSPSLYNYLSQNYPTWYSKTIREMREDFDIPDHALIPLEIMMSQEYYG